MAKNLTNRMLLRMTRREAEIIAEQADAYGCSKNTAARLLLRRGHDWTPHPSHPAHPETAPPDASGELAYFEEYGGILPAPPVPEGQVTISLDQEDDEPTDD